MERHHKDGWQIAKLKMTLVSASTVWFGKPPIWLAEL